MDHFFENRQHHILLLMLLIIAFFMLMFGNGIISLTHPDEVFYIQSSKEMLAHRSWFTPMIFDHVQFEKPFLAFMLFAGAMKWFGTSPFVARLCPALFGMIGVLITYWISWMLFNNKKTAFLSGLIITTSLIYIALSRAVLTDMIFSVFVTIAMGFFYESYSNKKCSDKHMLAGFVFSALAVLTKGFLGIAFPILIMLIFTGLRRDMGAFFGRKSFWVGLGVFALLSFPWHVCMYLQHGPWFIEEYFYNVHVRRLFASEHARLDNWYFYLMLMFVGVLPWSLFWITTVKNCFKSIREKMEHAPQIMFLLSWIAGVYLIMQPAHCKLASYIFPVFPAIAILFAHSITKQLNGDTKSQGMLSLTGYGMSILLLVIIVVGLFFARKYENVLFNLTPVYILSSLLLIISAGLFILNKRKNMNALVFAHSFVSCVLLVALFFARPYVEPWVSCIEVSGRLAKLDQSTSVVLASKFYVRAVRYYTDRDMAVIDINGKGFWSPHPIPFLNTDQKVTEFLKSQPVTYAVVKESNVDDLRRITNQAPFRREELGGEAGKYIIKITYVPSMEL